MIRVHIHVDILHNAHVSQFTCIKNTCISSCIPITQHMYTVMFICYMIHVYLYVNRLQNT